jgi:hypothetical protein
MFYECITVIDRLAISSHTNFGDGSLQPSERSPDIPLSTR